MRAGRPRTIRSGRCWARLASIGFLPREAEPGHDYTANLLHAEGDEICPRCLSWIAADQVVRRNVFGLVQHEACPVPVAADDIADIH